MNFRHLSVDCLAEYRNFLNTLLSTVHYTGIIHDVWSPINLERNPLYVGLRSVMTVLGQDQVEAEILRTLEQNWAVHLYVGEWADMCSEVVAGTDKSLYDLFQHKFDRALPTWCVVMVPPHNHYELSIITLNDSWFRGLIFNGEEMTWPGKAQVERFRAGLSASCDLIQYGSHQAARDARAAGRPPPPELPPVPRSTSGGAAGSTCH